MSASVATIKYLISTRCMSYKLPVSCLIINEISTTSEFETIEIWDANGVCYYRDYGCLSDFSTRRPLEVQKDSTLKVIMKEAIPGEVNITYQKRPLKPRVWYYIPCTADILYPSMRVKVHQIVVTDSDGKPDHFAFRGGKYVGLKKESAVKLDYADVIVFNGVASRNVFLQLGRD